jgi:hypothetical protein
MSYNFPIVINNFNRLTTTRALVAQLLILGYRNIHILDNNSTYPGLLNWYDKYLPNSGSPLKDVHVERLDKNLQGLSIYNSGYINKFKDYTWVAYTDSDISLGSNTPDTFLYDLVGFAEKYNKTKAGLALRIDNLPDTFYANYSVKNYEARHWANSLEKDVYDAPVDTTFCIIQPSKPFDYQAIRLGGDYTAEHSPWYLDWRNLDEEEQYYVDHAGEWSTYSKLYKRFKNQKDAEVGYY